MESTMYFVLLLLSSSICSATVIFGSGGEMNIYDPPVLASDFVDRFAGSSTIQGLLVNKILEDRRSRNKIRAMPYGRIIHSTYNDKSYATVPTISEQESFPNQRSFQETTITKFGNSNAIRLSSPIRKKRPYQEESIQQDRGSRNKPATNQVSLRVTSQSLSNALTRLVNQLLAKSEHNPWNVERQQRVSGSAGRRQGVDVTSRRLNPSHDTISPYQQHFRLDSDFKTVKKPTQRQQPQYSFVINVSGNMDPSGEIDNTQRQMVSHTQNRKRTPSDWQRYSNSNQYQPNSHSAPIKAISMEKRFFNDVLLTPALKR